MAAQITRLCGDEWQEWATRLLSCHYGPTEFQRIPDNDRGDAGLEGFTRADGHAYQAYGCEEPIGTAARYEKQRDKMTEDIGKFLRNKKLLQRLFGQVRITRWAMFVPYYDSKEIVAHAATKTEEVKAEKLPYVADTFQVCVCQEADFPVARDQLLNASTNALKIASTAPSPEQLVEWQAANQEPSATLRQKLHRLPTLRDDDARRRFHETVLNWYLRGQEILTALRQHPEVYAKVQAAKSHRESFLAAGLVSGAAPQEMLSAAINELHSTLKEEVRELHRFSSESLAYEAVADWLLRCPLDFPEGGSR